MIDTSLVLERVTRVAPLGMRFWDDVSSAVVADDLTVIAYPANNPALQAPASITHSGVYAFIDLPGLRDLENGSGDEAFWANLPARRPFVIQVIDNASRFQQFQLTAQVPVRGLFTLDCASPPTLAQAGVPLFSSPARAVPGGMAVLRADLWDIAADAPAAWTLIEASIEGQTVARTYADRQGRVALIFAYPEPPRFSISSPPSSRRALTDQTWTIQLHAFYSPTTPVPQIPDLCQVLNQAEANLYSNLSPALPLTETALEFGKELILKSQLQSVLLIAPAGSPPI